LGEDTVTLMRVRFGSHLYGTATPKSDTDFKGVHLPSARGILLCQPEEYLDYGTKPDPSRKNTAEDVDDDSFSLRRFFQMLSKGDMVAIELLFAPADQLLTTTPQWSEIMTHRHRLLTRECKGFVGYCQRQAAKYGVKGSRMATLRALLSILDEAIEAHGTQAKMADFGDTWQGFAASHEHAEILDIPNPDGSENLHLNVCDRKMGWSVTIKTARDVWNKVFEAFGARARAAEANEGIDWKAVSHAVRVGQQACELLETGKITFPRPNVDELLSIKRGERSYDVVAPMLETLLERVETLSRKSALRETFDQEFADHLIIRLHADQIARSGLLT